MDWTLAIDRNREALLRVIAMLFAAAGLTTGGSVATLPRHMRRTILRLLRPAESAARRLIVIVAHVMMEEGLTVAPHPARSCPKNMPRGTAQRGSKFPLFDARKRFDTGSASPPASAPRFSIPGLDDPVFGAENSPSSEDPVGAERLCRRMRALQDALDDLPRQAKRFARWQMRRDQRKSGRVSPLRPGWPPGHRQRPVHEVDTILTDCHALALYALAPP